MPTILPTNRLIDTNFENLRISSFTGKEAISSLYEHHVSALINGADVDPHTLCDQKISLHLKNNRPHRAFHGIISNLELGNIIEDHLGGLSRN